MAREVADESPVVRALTNNGRKLPYVIFSNFFSQIIKQAICHQNHMKQIPLLVLLSLIITMAHSSCSEGCIDCDQASSNCSACTTGYQLAIMGTCLPDSTIKNCALYGPLDFCLLCMPTYDLQNGTCEKVYTGCLVQNSATGVCVDCGFGTSLIDGLCKGVINCKVGNESCTECQEGFLLVNGTCTDNTGNCQTKNEKGICSVCIQDYTLVGYECISINVSAFGCNLYKKNGQCIACKIGFVNYQGYCLLPWQIAGIQQRQLTLADVFQQNNIAQSGSIQTEENITSNNSNFFGQNNFTNQGNTGNTASSGDSNQSHLSSSINMTSTQASQTDATNASSQKGLTKNTTNDTIPNGMILIHPANINTSKTQPNNNTLFAITTTTNTTATNTSINNISNCAIAQNGKCKTCNPNYTNTPNGCVLVAMFCQVYDTATGKCLSCNYNMILQNNTCHDPNCLVQSNGCCTQCNSFFSLSSTGICTFYDPNCANTSTTRCITCNNGYYVTSQGICFLFPPNCALPNIQNYTCITCLPDFQLNAQGGCDPAIKITIPNCSLVDTKGNCLQCATGYSLTNSSCLAISVLCQKYNKTNGGCVACRNGCSLENGICKDPNCAIQNGHSCASCFGGYYLVNKICTTIPIANCMTLDSKGKCIQCKTRYVLVGESCVLNPQPIKHCQSYNLITGNCINCISGYMLTNNTCTTISNTTNTTSTNTTNNTTNTSNTTTNNDPNCLKFANGSCLNCSNRFYYSTLTKLCSSVNPQCNTYNKQTGACLTCYSGYTLANGSCLISAPSYQDPNCKVSATVGCSQCYSGYYYNKIYLKCVAFNPVCKTSNQTDGSCLSCYSGYTVSNGTCIVANLSSVDLNCKRFSPSSICLQCSANYYLRQGICTQVSPLCKTYNSSSGCCLTCFPGYTLSGSSCIVSNNIIIIDSNCMTYSNSQCTHCYQGYYLAGNKCMQNNPLCKTINTNGQCTSCYTGYTLFAGNCQLQNNPTTDPNCKSPDTSGTCSVCYQGYYLDANKHCALANALCKTYTPSQADCTSCYPGYTLTNGDCVVDNTTNTTNTNNDPNCKSTDASRRCTACYQGYYLNQDKFCVLANSLCKTYNPSQDSCTSCYDGYALSNGDCITSTATQTNTTNNNDPNCQSTDHSGSCTACYQGYYLNSNKKCILANSLCKTFTPSQSECTSCYDGYTLSNGDCIISTTQINSTSTDPYCKSTDPSGVCTSCYQGYYLNSNKHCVLANTLCKTYTPSQENCTSCYDGYTLTNGDCVISTQTSTDPYCKSNGPSGTCTACYQGYYLNVNKKCVLANPLCKTYTPSQASCTSCYDGYTLNNGDCAVSTQTNTNTTTNSDPNCKSTDSNQICTTCYQGYYLNTNKHCALANALCKTFTPSQVNCTSCYSGYTLTNGDCIYSGDSTSTDDPYCLIKKNGNCFSCVGGYYLNKNSICILANPICKTVDNTGSCTSCYPGYSISGNICTATQDISIPNCRTSNGLICSACSEGYYLNNNECFAISPLCATYNSSSGACLTCVSGYTIKQGNCVQSSTKSDPNCASYTGSKCLKCKQGYLLQGQVCIAADPNCLAFDPSCHFCLACANKLTPKGIHCV